MIWNLIGLILNFIGSIIMWRFGIPNDVRPSGETFLLIDDGEPELVSKAKKYKVLQNLGIILLATGFLLQLVPFIFNSNVKNISNDTVSKEMDCQKYGTEKYGDSFSEGSVSATTTYSYSQKLDTCLSSNETFDSAQKFTRKTVSDILNGNETILFYSSNCKDNTIMKCLSLEEYQAKKDELLK